MNNETYASGTIRLETILDIIMGDQNVTEKGLAQVQGTIPLILSGDLKNMKHIPFKNYTTRELLQTKKLDHKLLTRERVLLALSRVSTVGKIGVFREEAIHSKAVVAMIPKVPLHIDFLFYVLKYMKYDITYEVNVLGKPSITLERLNSLPMPLLPSPAEQKRLADQLDALFQQVERELDTIGKMQENIQRLFHDALHDVFASANMTAWNKSRLGDLVTFVTHPLAPQPTQYAHYLYIDDTCIEPGQGQLNKKLLWGEQPQTQQAKNLLQNAQALVIYARSSPAKQRVAMLDIDEVLCPPTIAALRVKDQYRQQLLPEFLLWSLLSPPFTEFATNGFNAKSSSISERKLCAYEIPLPSKDVQRYLVKRLSAVQEITHTMNAKLLQNNAKMQQVEQQILQKFFQGNG